MFVRNSTDSSSEDIPIKKDIALEEVNLVLRQKGLPSIVQSEAKTVNGHEVVVIVVPAQTAAALNRDQGMLERIQGRLKCGRCIGFGVGLYAGLVTAVAIMFTFAVVGGPLYVIGAKLSNDEDPNVRVSGQDMVTAGTWVLITGGIVSGVSGIVNFIKGWIKAST